MPNDIDQVTAGQPAQVRFPGFNARLTPEVGAEVTQVAADVTRADVNSPPYYSVQTDHSGQGTETARQPEAEARHGCRSLHPDGSPFAIDISGQALVDQIAHVWRET